MTKIEWTEQTWNPVTGCTKISAGCKHCYAEYMAKRLQAMGQEKYKNGFGITLHPAALENPLSWRKPRIVFVNSMSDLFHEDVPNEFITKVLWTIKRAHWHTFQVLTKRADRMMALMTEIGRVNAPRGDDFWPIPNLWLGVSVENQQAADERIPHLLRTPAAVRFLSCEPLLGDIDLDFSAIGIGLEQDGHGNSAILGGIDWVICGCESGPNARPMNPDWARSLRDQCQSAGVAFFLKQMEVGGRLVKMPELDGKVWGEYPTAVV